MLGLPEELTRPQSAKMNQSELEAKTCSCCLARETYHRWTLEPNAGKLCNCTEAREKRWKARVLAN